MATYVKFEAFVEHLAEIGGGGHGLDAGARVHGKLLRRRRGGGLEST